MPIANFSGSAISNTYQRVVQTDGIYLADGTGSILNILNITASYALNASGSGGGGAFPYTGSAQITGSLGITGSLSFDPTATILPSLAQLNWNQTDKTLEFGTGDGNTFLQIGQETVYPPVVNKDSIDLVNGTLVMIDPTNIAQGNRIRVIRAISDGTYPSQYLVGVLTEDIAKNQEGFATWFGYVRNLNIPTLEANNIKSASETWVEGDVLYPSSTLLGGLTKFPPQAPALNGTIAVITAINGVNLTLLVRPTLTFTLTELTNVRTQGVTDGDILIRSGSLWISGKQLTGSYEITGSLNVSNSFTASSAIISGNVQVLGTASINTLVVNQTQLSTGSNQLGDAADDTQTLYGTVRVPTGSLTVTGSGTFTGNLITTGSINAVGTITTDSEASFRTNGITNNTYSRLGIFNFSGWQTGTQTAFFNGWNQQSYINTPLNIGIASTTMPARLRVRGSGTTSATTTLLIENSAGSASLKIDDDLNINLPSTAPKITLGGDLSIENTPYSSRRISIDILNSNINLNAGGFGECYFIGNRFTNSRTSEYYVTPNGLNYTGGALVTAYSNDGNILLNASNNGNRSIQLTGLGTTGAVLIGNISTGNGTSYSSILRVDSTTQGFLPPRTNLTSNISSPSQGLITYLTGSTNEGLYYYSSGSIKSWTKVLNDTGSQNISGDVTITGSLNISSSLFSTLITSSLNSGSVLLYNISTASYQAGFFDYYASSGSNYRAGTIMSVWGAGQIQFTDNSTPDIGNTSNFNFSMSISGPTASLYTSASNSGWSVKTTFRTI